MNNPEEQLTIPLPDSTLNPSSDSTLNNTVMVESLASPTLPQVSSSSSVSASPPEEQKEEKEAGNIDIRDIVVDYRKIRIYLDGVFDMTHYGHFRLFKAIKDKFPNSIVIAGVAGDEDTLNLKGQTVMDEKERAEGIGHCKWVDEVVCPCPWIITQEFVDEHKIDYVAHDGNPYPSGDTGDIYDFVKKQGKFIATQRTDGISTTDLINRIVKRYNEFVLRNLSRGVSRADLNVSLAREMRMKMENAWKEKSTTLLEAVNGWMDDPSQFVDDFLHVFGPGGKIANDFKRKANQIKEDFVEYAQFAPM